MSRPPLGHQDCKWVDVSAARGISNVSISDHFPFRVCSATIISKISPKNYNVLSKCTFKMRSVQLGKQPKSGKCTKQTCNPQFWVGVGIKF